MTAIFAVVLGACAMRGAPPATVTTPAVAPPSATIGPGPARFSGLEVDIPEGWTGEVGPPGSGLALSLVSASLGTTVELWVFARGSGLPGPRPRPGCVSVFLDEVGTHRAVPGLGPARAASCIEEDAGGAVVQGWYAAQGDREAHVEVVHPAGRAVAGRAAIEPILQSIRWAGPKDAVSGPGGDATR